MFGRGLLIASGVKGAGEDGYDEYAVVELYAVVRIGLGDDGGVMYVGCCACTRELGEMETKESLRGKAGAAAPIGRGSMWYVGSGLGDVGDLDGAGACSWAAIGGGDDTVDEPCAWSWGEELGPGGPWEGG